MSRRKNMMYTINGGNAQLFSTDNTRIDCGIINIPSIQMPLFASSVFLYKSLKESTVKTLTGEEAISVSSEVSTSFPIPKTNTAAPFFWRRDDAISRGVYSPWSVVCLPVVMTRTGWKKKKWLRETGSHMIKQFQGLYNFPYMISNAWEI